MTTVEISVGTQLLGDVRLERRMFEIAINDPPSTEADQVPWAIRVLYDDLARMWNRPTITDHAVAQLDPERLARIVAEGAAKLARR